MESVLALAVIPAVVYGLVMLVVLWPRMTRARYKAGEEWNFPPVFWVANPAGVSTTSPPAGGEDGSDAPTSTARGGARGNW